MTARVAILISGRGSNMAALLDAMADPEFPAEPVLVLSNRADAKGLETAAARGVPTIVVDHAAFEDREAFEKAVDAELERAGAEIVCLAGFMRVLTAWLVARWKGRMINIHPSLLPMFPGLHTHERALDAGVRITGCTVHLVSTDVDDGPILGQAAVPVLEDDDADALAARVLEAEHKLYPACLRALIAPSGETDGATGELLFSPPIARP